MLEQFPVAPMLLVLLIPLAYSFWKRKERKAVIVVCIACVFTVAFYPLVNILANLVPTVGYFLGKIILFIFIPILAVFFLEKWSLKNIFIDFGVRRKALGKSVSLGIAAAIVTIAITLLVSVTQWDLAFRSIMFFESFTEEFFFRGFLLLYLMKKTTPKIAYSTSVLGFVLIHPQHFNSLFLISTIAQGLLLAWVAGKTKNIIGPWIAHGANRFFPSLLRMIFQ
ncbi:MAG: CPBP family intramembrane metalloprotease [Candidatus Aenigmarchaeota archaeon]|nr:CPBP family intramembrane metalloprotease [Candidatus Aenigmarchaeota archaeon]